MIVDLHRPWLDGANWDQNTPPAVYGVDATRDEPRFSVIDPNCGPESCRYWIANAGGGIWRTDNVLAPQPEWEYVSGEFDYNNTAALELDPNNPDTIYAGLGDPS